MATPESNPLDAASPLEPSQPLAVATGSLPLYTVECRNLLYAAKLIEAEAATWADGWAVREKDGSLRWDKPDEWAHVRWHHLCVAAKNLRSIAARFTKKANK